MKSANTKRIKTILGCFLLALSLIFSLVGCQFASFSSPSGNDGNSDADVGESGTPPANEGGEEGGQTSGEASDPTPLFYNRYTGLTCDEAVSSCRPVSICMGNFDGKGQEGLSFADILIEMPVSREETRLWMLTNDVKRIESIKNVADAESYAFSMPKAFGALCVFNGTKDISKDVDALNYASGSLGEYFSSTDGVVSTSGERLFASFEANSLSLSDKNQALPFRFAELENRFVPQGNSISSIHFAFSEKNTVDFTYQKESGKYFRSQGGRAHKDAYNGEELSYENIILLFANVNYYHSANGTSFTLDMTAGGSGFFYTGGGVQSINWSFEESGALSVKNEAGELITVNRGKTYIGVLKITDSTTLIAK